MFILKTAFYIVIQKNKIIKYKLIPKYFQRYLEVKPSSLFLQRYYLKNPHHLTVNPSFRVFLMILLVLTWFFIHNLLG